MSTRCSAEVHWLWGANPDPAAELRVGVSVCGVMEEQSSKDDSPAGIPSQTDLAASEAFSTCE